MSLCVGSTRLHQRRTVIEMNWNDGTGDFLQVLKTSLYASSGDDLFSVIANESIVASLR